MSRNILSLKAFYTLPQGLIHSPVLSIVRAGIVHPDNNEDMLELALEVGYEGQGPGLLEDDGDDVVSDVALPGQLLAVVGGEGEEGGHVEHHLVARVLRVHRVQAS